MRVVLHIGTNKTGTSAIQGFLHYNPQYLAELGFIYPLTGRAGTPHHANLAHVAQTSPNDLPLLVSQIEKEAKDAGAHSVIISSEFLHTINPAPILQAFHRHELSTVVFLRDHVSYLSSWYREAIKSNDKTYSFWDFITLVRAPYSSWISNWPNPHIVQYDRNFLRNHSAVDELVHFLDPQAPTPPPYQEENISISGNLLFAKQIVNNVITYDQMESLRSEIQHLATLNSTFSGPMKISDREFEYIEKTYASDAVRMSAFPHINLTFDPKTTIGHPSPDLNSLPYDLSLLSSYSHEHGFGFGDLLSRVFSVRK